MEHVKVSYGHTGPFVHGRVAIYSDYYRSLYIEGSDIVFEENVPGRKMRVEFHAGGLEQTQAACVKWLREAAALARPIDREAYELAANKLAQGLTLLAPMDSLN